MIQLSMFKCHSLDIIKAHRERQNNNQHLGRDLHKIFKKSSRNPELINQFVKHTFIFPMGNIHIAQQDQKA